MMQHPTCSVNNTSAPTYLVIGGCQVTIGHTVDSTLVCPPGKAPQGRGNDDLMTNDSPDDRDRSKGRVSVPQPQRWNGLQTTQTPRNINCWTR